jgi:hypothetical protein
MALMMTVAVLMMKVMKDRKFKSYPVAPQEECRGRVIYIQSLKMWRERSATPIALCVKHSPKLRLRV